MKFRFFRIYFTPDPDGGSVDTDGSVGTDDPDKLGLDAMKESFQAFMDGINVEIKTLSDTVKELQKSVINSQDGTVHADVSKDISEVVAFCGRVGVKEETNGK